MPDPIEIEIPTRTEYRCDTLAIGDELEEHFERQLEGYWTLVSIIPATFMTFEQDGGSIIEKQISELTQVLVVMKRTVESPTKIFIKGDEENERS